MTGRTRQTGQQSCWFFEDWWWQYKSLLWSPYRICRGLILTAFFTYRVCDWLMEVEGGIDRTDLKDKKSLADPRQQNMGFEIRVVKRAWKYGYISTKKRKSPKDALLPKMPFQGISVCLLLSRQAYTPRTFHSDLVDYNFKIPWSLRTHCHRPCPHWHASLATFSDGWGLFWALRSVWFISTDDKVKYLSVSLQNKNPIPLEFWNSAYPVVW